MRRRCCRSPFETAGRCPMRTGAGRAGASSRRSPRSSATLNTSVSTPAWVSLRLRTRESRSGRRAVTVGRAGWPWAPNTSQKTTGAPVKRGASAPISFSRSSNLGEVPPGWLMPARSPLTSAMNTGTPIRDNRSAITWRETVLPVPVAPVMIPWRLASAGRRSSSSSPRRAMGRGSGVRALRAGIESPQCRRRMARGLALQGGENRGPGFPRSPPWREKRGVKPFKSPPFSARIASR